MLLQFFPLFWRKSESHYSLLNRSRHSLQKSDQENSLRRSLYKKATRAICSFSRANRSFAHKKTIDSLKKPISEFSAQPLRICYAVVLPVPMQTVACGYVNYYILQHSWG